MVTILLGPGGGKFFQDKYKETLLLTSTDVMTTFITIATMGLALRLIEGIRFYNYFGISNVFP